MESEDSYSHEIARRSVARAALHLGIETCSEEVLHVLADILIAYLERVGMTMSKMVEASGRTSAHVNWMDALQAVEMVTPSGLMRQWHVTNDNGSSTVNGSTSSAADGGKSVGISSEGAGGGGSASGGNHAGHNNPLTTMGNTWQDLAVFLFGPNWNQTTTTASGEHRVYVGQGKVGPSSATSGNDRSTGLGSAPSGWEAPYLDEIPPYPTAKPTCANPHPMPPHEGLSLHTPLDMLEKDENGKDRSGSQKGKSENDTSRKASATLLDEAMDETLKHMPDVAFWGQMGSSGARSPTVSSSSNKRKRGEPSTDNTQTKRVRLAGVPSGTTSDQEEHRQKRKEQRGRRPHYLASFMPSLPDVASNSKKTVGEATIADSAIAVGSTATAATDQQDGTVKGSLVDLQGFYWGSGWDGKASNGSNASNDLVKVATNTSASGASGKPNQVVVPLGRASGSRVSRILEGSMDVMS